MRRPLLLNGFMGVGKSTIARALAEVTGRPMVDLDERLEAHLGTTIADYFSSHGEAAFRVVERRELELALADALSSTAAPIIALGGGALLSRPLRLYALDNAVVVTLEADLDDIAQRTAQKGVRPLLDRGDTLSRARELLELRAPVYAEAHGRVRTSQRSPAAVCDEVLAIWRRDGLAVAAGMSSYTVEIGRGIAAERLPALVGKASSVLLVSDEHVAPLHGGPLLAALGAHGIATAEHRLESGEQHKTIASIEGIWQSLQRAGADRRSVCIGLGGGVATDMTGFAAATWMRGVRWVGLPTTLLAMVDASTGGKTGVDLGPAKNAVGAFWQPAAVLCDVALEATEPQRNYVGALAEVVKTAIIGDAALLDLLERESARVAARDLDLIQEIVRRSVRVKARIVSEDERESGLRAVLNLGHTVGHALEAQAGYARLAHGEAVSLGLVAALRLGVLRQQTPAALEQRVTRLLATLGLPTDLSKEPLSEAADLIAHDKKKAGKKLRFVFAREAGRVETQDLDLAELSASVRALT